MFQLTNANYYSAEANRAYMSVSAYKCWLECPSRWMAQYGTGEFSPVPTDALALGSLFHTLVLEPELEQQTLEEHAEYLHTKSGKLTAGTEGIYAMSSFIQKIPEIMQHLEGEHEVIVTGKIGGTNWKGKLDNINHEGIPGICGGKPFFSDLKSAASLTKETWVSRLGTHGNFIHTYNYGLQLAIYQELLRQKYGKDYVPVIVGCTKPTKTQPTPDVKAFVWTDKQALEFMLSDVRYDMTEVKKQVEVATYGRRCESSECEWCKRSRKQWVREIGAQPFNPYRAE